MATSSTETAYFPSETLLALLNEETKALPLSPQVSVDESLPPGSSATTWRPVDAQLEKECQLLFMQMVRNLVNTWLDSGKSGSVDIPKDRNLGNSEQDEPWKALNSRIKEIGYIDTDSGERASFPSLAQSVIRLAKNGKLIFSLPTIVMTGDGIFDAKNYATLLFLQLLQSPMRYRIAKCSKPQCCRYFYYERAPKGILKSGTLCPNHRSHGGTVRKSRQRRLHREKLLRLAADVWLTSFAHADRYQWIAKQVNRRLRRTGQSITKRFITQNDEHIEKLTEKSHA